MVAFPRRGGNNEIARIGLADGNVSRTQSAWIVLSKGEATTAALFVRACASVTQSIDSLVACRGGGGQGVEKGTGGGGGGGVSPQNTNTASHACAMQPHGMHSIRT